MLFSASGNTSTKGAIQGGAQAAQASGGQTAAGAIIGEFLSEYAIF